MGYPVWGFRIEKKSPDFRSPEVGISDCDYQVINFFLQPEKDDIDFRINSHRLWHCLGHWPKTRGHV